MLIRSQDKKTVAPLNFIKLHDAYRAGTLEVVGCNVWIRAFDEIEIIGTYSTEAKAIKVLDMIEAEYKKQIVKCSKVNEYEFVGVPPKVFQMPQDEEVQA